MPRAEKSTTPFILIGCACLLTAACSSTPAGSVDAHAAAPVDTERKSEATAKPTADVATSLPAVANALQDPALLTGQWIARIDNGATGAHAIRVLDVSPSGDWTLHIAPEETGYLVADKGQWSLNSAGKRLEDGAYALTGPDAFTTKGAIAAAWTRIPTTRRAARVEHAIVSGMILRASMGASAMTQGPVDQGLVGIWEGQGEKDRSPVELVMAIHPNGMTGLVWVSTYKGTLDRGKNGVSLVATAPRYQAVVSNMERASFRTTDGTGAVDWARKPPPNPRIEPTSYGDPRQAPRNRFGK